MVEDSSPVYNRGYADHGEAQRHQRRARVTGDGAGAAKEAEKFSQKRANRSYQTISTPARHHTKLPGAGDAL